MKRLPWMYTIISFVLNPNPIMYECPLCFAIVGKEIKKHTAWHESRGEEDHG